MASFWKYYGGHEGQVAPVLTVFVGGNHEASNHLWELFHGGWVAPNIYYLGEVAHKSSMRIHTTACSLNTCAGPLWQYQPCCMRYAVYS